MNHLHCPDLALLVQTTLMDVLAGRKTVGTIAGDVRVNGFPKEQATFAAIAGCEWALASPPHHVHLNFIYGISSDFFSD